MNMRKLSETQVATLAAMEPGRWYNAYQLGERLSTLFSLADRGLVERRDHLGSFSFPRSNIKFRKIEVSNGS